MTRKTTVVLGLILLVVALGIWLAAGNLGQLLGGAAKPLQVGVLSDVSSAPLRIAELDGYFKAENANVELVPFKSAADRDTALQSGAIDGAISDVLAAALMRNGGFDVKITSRTEGVYCLMLAPGSAIGAPGEMAGKSVALSPNTIIEYCIDQMMAQSGVDPSALDKQVVRDMPARLTMLLEGKVDAAGVPEPMASAAAKQGATLLASNQTLGIDCSTLCFSAAAIDGKSRQIEAFYRALEKAYAAINQDPAKAVSQLTGEGGFPEGIDLQLPTYQPTHMIERGSFDTCIQWMLAKGLIDKPVAFEDATTGAFAK